MASLNKSPKRKIALRQNSHETHGGAPAAHIDSEAQLRRSVMSCLLWEDEHYENGEKIADRIALLAREVKPAVLASIAVEARRVMNLRHVPLWLLVALFKTARGDRKLIVDTMAKVIRRADEPGELLALYWKANGKDAPLSNPLRVGLAEAIKRFDAYQMAKYAKKGDVRLRDVMFLTHPKPTDAELFRKVAEDELSADDAETWEAQLSGGADKKAVFESLLREGKLGYLALLRNMRNMIESGCDADLIEAAILARRGADRVLPFRYVAAARFATTPRLKEALNAALMAAVRELVPLMGKTVVLVDVSSSMGRRVSDKSDMTRMDAAGALASIIPATDLTVATFSDRVVVLQAPPRGLLGIKRIARSQPNSNTRLFEAVAEINERFDYDRLIVISDEQATYDYAFAGSDRMPGPRPGSLGYMINVASARNGVGYGKWVHLDGWSEGILRYIAEYEAAR